MSPTTNYKNFTLISCRGLVCFWDFSAEDPLVSKGPHQYRLNEGGGNVSFNYDSSIGRIAAEFREGNFFFIPRNECPALNISGKTGVTIIAAINRRPKSYIQCEAVAGMWNETERLRQYCLFLNLRLSDSGDQVCGHISGVGGPTPGQKWCIDASIGNTKIEYDSWQLAAFTYDGASIRSYINGKLDAREGHNPYPFSDGIFNPGSEGSDFTIAAVHRLGEMGNFFVGKIASVAVFNRALNEHEINAVQEKSYKYLAGN